MIVLNTTGCCCCCVYFTVDFHPFTRCFNKICHHQRPNNPINYISSVITYQYSSPGSITSQVTEPSNRDTPRLPEADSGGSPVHVEFCFFVCLFFFIIGAFVISVFATDIFSTILWPCAPRVKKNSLMGVIGSYSCLQGGLP